MSITKLFLFTKDTDASATEQGFLYQKLKTLKTWVENRVNEVDDVIYCDYEDDIFERNIEQGKSKFRQVKLCILIQLLSILWSSFKYKPFLS